MQYDEGKGKIVELYNDIQHQVNLEDYFNNHTVIIALSSLLMIYATSQIASLKAIIKCN